MPNIKPDVSKNNKTGKKRLIGILAGHDAPERSNQLFELFIELYHYLTTEKARLKENREQNLTWFSKHYHFVFTGGTFCRLILGYDPVRKEPLIKSPFKTLSHTEHAELRKLIIENSTVLPPYSEGGIILLTQLIVQRQCSILWSFLTPSGSHWIMPENLALLRLCDFNNVKKQMNLGSAIEWVQNSMKIDSLKNLSSFPISIYPGCEKGHDKVDKVDTDRKDSILRANTDFYKYAARYLHSDHSQDNDKLVLYIKSTKADSTSSILISSYKDSRQNGQPWYHKTRAERTIALIAHDGMKDKMVAFAIDFEDFLSGYKRIVTTSTTGDKIRRSTRKLGQKIDACFSGPKGGDIEIAVQILTGDIQTVVFFIDPTSTHAHIDDIRVVFGAAMINPQVRMLTNERQARQRFNDIMVSEAIEMINLQTNK